MQKKFVIIFIFVFVFFFLFFWIRYGAIFGDDGIFDKDYHRQTITNANTPLGYGNEWTPQKPYICRQMKDSSNPENPFQHRSLGVYIGQWLFFPSIMESEKANKKS